MKVKDFMKKEIISVSSDTSIYDALKIIQNNKIRRMPVVDNGKLVGIITRKAIKEASPSKATTLSVYELNYLLAKMTVKDIMKKKVITINSETPFEEAAYLMHKNRIGGLPVMEGAELVGYVSSNDIFDVMVKMHGFDHPAARVTIEIKEGKWHESISKCLELVDKDQDEFKMISIMDSPDNKKYLVIRFRTAKKVNIFVEAMRNAGYNIVSVFEDTKLI